MTTEDIIAIYKKVFPTRYEPMTLDRMLMFARLVEEKVKHGN